MVIALGVATILLYQPHHLNLYFLLLIIEKEGDSEKLVEKSLSLPLRCKRYITAKAESSALNKSPVSESFLNSFTILLRFKRQHL